MKYPTTDRARPGPDGLMNRFRRSARPCRPGLGMLLAVVMGTAPAAAQVPERSQGADRPVYDTAAGGYLSVSELMERLQGAEVVHVGETHTDFAHHLAQLEILRHLHARNPHLVMGWEMFHSSQQPLLDAYTRWGTLNEIEWRDAIWWQHTWGHPYEQYRPLLDYAHRHRVRVMGLNAPREVVRNVRLQGPDRMPEESAWWLPAGFWERITLPQEAEYKAWFLESAGHAMEMDEQVMEGMFASQTAWNEIMAWNVAKTFRIMPEEQLQVLVIAGSGHLIFRQGIPTRLELFEPGLSQVVVLPVTRPDVMPREQILEEQLDRRADYLWFVPPAEDPPMT